MKLDSSVARCQIHIEAINNVIQERRLSVEEVHKILLSEIQQELQKPEQEINLAYIEACEQVIDSLYLPERKEYVSAYQSNWRLIQRRLSRRSDSISHRGINIGWWRVPIVACIAAFVLCVGLIVPDGWILTHQTDDEEQYIMQGIETPAGFRSVAEAGPALAHTGIYSTTEWQEAVCLMGGIPAVPQRLPIGWRIVSYTVSLTDVSSGITIEYQKDSTGGYLTFQSTTFFELSSLYTYIEQNGEGVVIKRKNGTEIYVTENMDRFTATWHSTHSSYMLSGDVSQEELMRIIDSIE